MAAGKNMLLSELYRRVRSTETIENYARARKWWDTNYVDQQKTFVDHSMDLNPLHSSRTINYSMVSDKDFWQIVFRPQEDAGKYTFRFDCVVLSEWVARVPGLFWSKKAEALRTSARSSIELKSEELTVYAPLGKSQIVHGGIGTLKFSPDVMGNRIVTLSHGNNASSGIPAIILSDVWDYHKLAEGDVLYAQAHWQGIPSGWEDRFPSMKGIPRGCLMINHPKQIEFIARKQPVQFHPCTVMEYQVNDAMLYDFVYATADTHVKDYRQKLEHFFETYKDRNERNGKYLIPADHSLPLFDSVLPSSSNLGDSAQLRLIKERVRQSSFNGQTLDEIVQALASNFDNDDLQTMSRDIQIPISLWFTGDISARSANQLVDICLQKNKIEELVDAIVRQKSDLVI